jgi:hypothetical protein
MSIQAEKAPNDTAVCGEDVQQAALCYKNEMVSEKVLKTRMEKLINARAQAVKNLYRANLEYEKNFQGEKKNYVVENLLAAIHEYDAADSALNAAQ